MVVIHSTTHKQLGMILDTKLDWVIKKVTKI